MRCLLPIWAAVACLGCALVAPGGRYAPRDKNCVVRTVDEAPPGAVDDLGIVTVDCWTGDGEGCQQVLLDEVCRRGGDVVWGIGSATPSTSKLSAHVARTKRAPDGAGR
jgi:hypothetical protein